jgi:hypothetical protein
MSGNNFIGFTGTIGTIGTTGIITGANSHLVGGGYSNSVIGYASSLTSNTYKMRPYIIGGQAHFGKYRDIHNTVVLSASDRDIDISAITNNSGELFTEENISGSVFINSDNGIWIETSEKGKYMNLVEIMKDYVEIKKTLTEYQTMLTDLYYAPPYGPGYLKSQASFKSTIKEINETDTKDDDSENDEESEDSDDNEDSVESAESDESDESAESEESEESDDNDNENDKEVIDEIIETTNVNKCFIL